MFQNFQLQHNLLFYALSKYKNKNKYLDDFCKILKKNETLKLDDTKINDLKETFNSETVLLEEEKENLIKFNLKKKRFNNYLISRCNYSK
jgi:hypothetical protein